MGQLDQLAKRILREETGAATQERVAFEVPREVPVGALAPDGVVRVVRAEGLASLPAPWCRLRVEATLDVKMPGDHTDRAALARNELRRHARWTHLLEEDRERARKGGTAAPVRDPRGYTAWLVAPVLPRWVRSDAALGFFSLEAAGEGCWWLGMGAHETLWIAANELPLSVEMLPFLVARSGRAQAEFLAWSLGVKGPAWTWDVVQQLPMSPEAADEFYHFPADPEEQREIRTRYAKRWVEAYPEAAEDLIAAVRLKAEQELQQERQRTEQELQAKLRQDHIAVLRHSVLAVLSARKLTVSDALRARVEATDDLAVLDAWLLAAATAASVEDAIH